MDKEKVLTEYLLNLDNQDFSFIASSILGPTSFLSKANTIKKLISFFSNSDNIEGLIASLNDSDIRFLTLLYVLGNLDEIHISRLKDIYHLTDTIDSLKKRLIIITNDNYYVLNPLFKEILIDKVINLDSIFGSNIKNYDTHPIVDRNVLFAIINLILRNAVPLSASKTHNFEKSPLLKQVFPQFNDNFILAFKVISSFLYNSNLLYIYRNSYKVNLDYSKTFFKVSNLELSIFASCSFIDFNSPLPLYIERLLSILNLHSIEKETFLNLLNVLYPLEKENLNLLFDILISLGLVIKKDNLLFSNPLFNEEKAPRSTFMVDSNFTLSYYGQINRDDNIYLYSDILICDNLVTYQITKDSFARAYEYGISISDINKTLQNNLLKDYLYKWEEYNSRVTLFDGILINCKDEQSAQIIKNLPSLKKNILLEVSNNSFLMDRFTYHTWEKALCNALDLKQLNTNWQHYEEGNYKDDFEFFELSNTLIKEPKAFPRPSWEDQKRILYFYAKEKNIFSDEAKALIDSSVIYCKEQLDSFKSNKMMSASGFDFNAKLVLLKDVLKSKNSLVILELSDKTIVAKLISIEKDDKKKDILRVQVVPSLQSLNLFISQIFKISIFCK